MDFFFRSCDRNLICELALLPERHDSMTLEHVVDSRKRYPTRSETFVRVSDILYRTFRDECSMLVNHGLLPKKVVFSSIELMNVFTSAPFYSSVLNHSIIRFLHRCIMNLYKIGYKPLPMQLAWICRSVFRAIPCGKDFYWL